MIFNSVINNVVGLFASIFVTDATNGDTIILITPSGKTKNGIWGTSNDIDGYLFDKLNEFGTYTLTATRYSDGETVTQSVLVDAVTKFYVQVYKVSLVPEIPVVTGTDIGFKRAYDRSIGYDGSWGTDPAYIDDSIFWTADTTKQTYSNGIIYTAQVDMSQFSKIKAKISLGASCYCSLVVVSGYTTYEAAFFVVNNSKYIKTDYKTVSAGEQEIELDVSGVSSNAYVGFIARPNNSSISISALDLVY